MEHGEREKKRTNFQDDRMKRAKEEKKICSDELRL